MKKFAVLMITFLALNLSSNVHGAIGTTMKVEGSCTGRLSNGTTVSFTYFSDFNGCRKTNKAALNFTSGNEGLLTGSRTFSKGKDIYSFPAYKLTFEDSTGNVSGTLSYTNAQGKKRTTEVSCDVRDYEYSDC